MAPAVPCPLQTTICKGDLVQFSVWLKFVDKVPPYDAHATGGGGIGLKHHSGSNPAEQDSGDAMIYSEFLGTMKPNEWTLVTKTWVADYSEADLLILIMDHAPSGTVGRFCDLRVTKLINTPVLFFRGGGDYVAFPHKVDWGLPVGDSAYTIEAWVQPHTHNNNGIIGWGDPNGAATTLRLGANGQVVMGWGVNEGELVTAEAGDARIGLDDGTWHHIAATYDGKIRVIYVNGVELIRDTPGKPHNGVGGNLRIGSVLDAAYFEGAIGEVRIWETARTGLEIIHYKTAEVQGDEEGLFAYWKLNDGGNSARDSSPKKLNGYVVGGTVLVLWQNRIVFERVGRY
jgi:hypothetical protein